jgi:UDP-3-O-[3-hydroxymyristoyl] N-acetylglucosamine deacetylase/3-hydroxyacyl-[acyl-carrier-protein] dehydratase
VSTNPPESGTDPKDGAAAPVFDINQIMKILPHRYPFLLIDRIVESRDKFVAGIKCVTMNEWFFQGHFPAQPVMPGVLIIEAMAQTGAVMVHQYEENRDKLVYLAGIDGARFRKLVQPGDVLRIEMSEIYRRRGMGKCEGKAFVNGELACEATLMFVAQR